MSTPIIPRFPVWSDPWLLEHFRRAGHAAVERAVQNPAANSAWEALSAAGLSDETICRAAQGMSGAERATPEQLAAADAALLPRAVALRHRVVPLAVDAAGVSVATANPLAAALEEEIRFVLRGHVTVRVATPAEVQAALDRLYPRETARPVPVVEIPLARMTAADWQDRILREALAAGASDIHVEPLADGALVIRFRVDGSLYDALHVPVAAAVSLVSRFKVTAGLDIADRIRPQDGRSTVPAAGRTVDLRISTLPLGERGEKVVIRVLDARTEGTGLDRIGFLPAELHRFQKLLEQREGMVLVTGPTGSGKTTTLYSALDHVRSGETNVVTVEDPIEYRLEGVNQVQVNERAGLTFASVLRSMLRQDPDVILVGEIRDGETAAIALKASMTGHLVLSTLHTNDAASAVHRLLDLGVDPVVLGASLKGVVAQRLVRRLCTDCCQPIQLSDLPVEQQALLGGRGTGSLRQAVGCGSCRGTGYRGRLVVPELLLVTPEVGRGIAKGSAGDVGELAVRAGMVPLWESGLERVLLGLTSMHELIDNIPAPMDAGAASQADVDSLLAKLLGGSAPASPTPVVPLVAPRAAGTGPRILLVDEDRAERATVRATLEADGFRVLEAADGEAALSYARRLTPDAVVTDLVLLRLDGIGLLQGLAGAGMPVLVYTSQTDEALLAWATELGAAEVLNKTADRRFVALRLQALLGAARGRREDLAGRTAVG